ncbi:MAG: 4-(cytidine 5'-diphospho)-2-C-methyl-D-erythritol kinase [Acidobacteria bacterium]|nr:4-(cytidine 5'-diphospho)-2-C-methyl-D-erythritol kinase [Acidobacteriota bacterium]
MVRDRGLTMTDEIRVRAYAKVNLGLEVLRRRSDGFHELRTFFQMIDWHDELRFQPAASGLHLRISGLRVPGGKRENLVLRAARALRRAGTSRRGAQILLCKRVPPGTGLGGGSSDAAATLLALRRLWSVPLSFAGLVAVARELGADVPFFLSGGAAFAAGRGDRIRPLRTVLDRRLVVVCPRARLATGTVFEAGSFRLTPGRVRIRIGRLKEALSGRSELADLLRNDLEEAAVRSCPEIAVWKRRLAETGAEAVAMTGSGPAVYGLYSDRGRAEEAAVRLEAEGVVVRIAAPVSRDRFRGEMEP